MKNKKNIIIATAVLVLAVAGWITYQSIRPSDPDPKIVTPATEMVNAMRVGWNLSNALESIDNQKRGINTPLEGITPEEYYETLWRNPVTTEAMIQTVANAGFGSVRIPVTFTDHMDADFQIRTEWLERIREIVDYVLGNNMFCIINLHHDTGSGSWPWLKANPDTLEQDKENLKKVWMQYADFFKDYDDRLVFEGFNELIDTDDHWDNANPGAYEAVNVLNQVFVDTVRAGGGYNPHRFLIVNTYGAGVSDDILDAFVLPRDDTEDRLIVGVHSYLPLDFTWPQNQVTWTVARTVWNKSTDEETLKKVLDSLKSNFIDKGIPVIIGELGAWNKNNLQDRIDYISYIIGNARDLGITCFWWDHGGMYDDPEKVDTSALLDRYNNEWYFPEIVNSIIIAAR